MKRALLIAVLALSSMTAAANSIGGKWQNYDDKDGKPKAIVQISGSGGSVVGVAAGVNPNCPTCAKPGPLVGRRILSGLQSTGGNQYEGDIIDPKNGKAYNAFITVNGSSLRVCGSPKWVGKFAGRKGVSRCQTWRRVG